MDHAVTWPNEGQQQGRDRRHTAAEHERVVGIFPQSEPVLEDLLVWPVEARINEALRAAGDFAGYALEETFAGRRVFKHERRGQEDRRLQRAPPERRAEAVPHLQGRGLKGGIAVPG